MKNDDLTDKDIANLIRHASLSYMTLQGVDKSSEKPQESLEGFVVDFTRNFLATKTRADLKAIPANIRRQEELLGIKPPPGRER